MGAAYDHMKAGPTLLQGSNLSDWIWTVRTGSPGTGGSLRQAAVNIGTSGTAPNSPNNVRGPVLWIDKQYSEAATEFQAELTNNPNHVPAMTYLADSDIQLNHPEAAKPLLERVVHIDAKSEMAHLDLGILYADAGRRDDALQEFWRRNGWRQKT